MNNRRSIALLGLIFALWRASVRRRQPRAGAAPPAPGALELRVPRAPAPVKIDAELEGKKLWEADTGTTGNFVDGAGAAWSPTPRPRRDGATASST